MAIIDSTLRALTGKPRQVFNYSARDALSAPKGWYYWTCFALGGMLAVNVMADMASWATNTISASLAAPTTGGSNSDAAAAGGATAPGSAAAAAAQPPVCPRVLPYRYRSWLDTCVLTPYWEETFFRGFLLTTLTK